MNKRTTLTRPEREGAYTAGYVRKPGDGEASSDPTTKSLKDHRDQKIKSPHRPPLKGAVGEFFITRTGAESEVLKRILDLVHQLEPAERKHLLTELALAEQMRKAPDRDLDMWARSALDALHRAISTQDGGVVGLLPLRRLLGARSAWEPVDAFMSSTGLADLSVVQRNAAYSMLAGLLIEHAQRIARHTNIPLTGKLVANCTGQIAAIFDQAFPGYAAAGLVHMLPQMWGKRESST